MRAALAAGRRRVRRVFVAQGRKDADEVVELARAAGVEVVVLDQRALAARALTGNPQGVIAECEPLRVSGLEEIALGAGRPGVAHPRFVVVLDGITDPRNLGAIARSAEAGGAAGLVVGRHEASPVTATAAKAAVGAFEWLPVAVVGRIPAALRELKRAGLWIVALDGDGDESLFGHVLLTEPLALVIGSEGRGAGRLVKELADAIVRIPMLGRTPSLNAAAAATLSIFEVARTRTG